MVKLIKIVVFTWILASDLHAADDTALRLGVWQKDPLRFQNLHPIEKFRKLGYLHQFVFRPLLAVNPKGQWQCILCAKIPNFEDKSAELAGTKKSPQLIAHWQLRKDLKWADGLPLTAADVYFSFIVAKTLALSGLDVPRYVQTIESIELDKNNPLVFHIKYMGAFHDFYQMEDFYLLPKHLEDNPWQSSETDIDEYFTKSNYYKDPSLPGLYNGPYLLQAQSEDMVSLQKNPFYSHATQLITEIKVLRVQSPTHAKQLLSTNKLDVLAEYQGSVWDIIQLEKDLKLGGDPKAHANLQFLYRENDIFETLIFNLRNPILSDGRVRRALLTAINRKQLVHDLFAGANHPANSFDSKQKSQPLGYSTKSAEQFLQASGWKEQDTKGVRSKDAQSLKLDLVIAKNHPWRQQIAERFKQAWQEIGIETNIKEVSAEEFHEKIVPKAHFDDMVLLSWQLTPGAIPRAFLHSKEIPGFENEYYGQNIGAWRNNKVDLLLEKLARSFDKKTYDDFLEELVSLYHKDVPGIPLFNGLDAAIVHVRVKNFALSPHRQTSALWAENWRLP